MFPVSDQYKAAIDSTHTAVRRVEVRNQGLLLDDITKWTDAGSVSVDETRQIRRTLSLTLGVPFELIPDVKGDLLHPAGGNELYVYRGIKYPQQTALTVNGVPTGQVVTQETPQLGVFRMTKPVVTDPGDVVTVAVSGQDRSSVISRINWLQPYSVAALTFLNDAITTALETRVAGTSLDGQLTPLFTPNDIQVPATTWGANPGTSTNDPWADFIALAATAGYELFFNVYGQPVMQPISDPTLAKPVKAYIEAQNCRMSELERTLDETQTYNGVTIYCNGVGADCPPFTVSVWDTDPDSPTYYLGPWGQVSYPIVTTAIPGPIQSESDAMAQAIAMATSQLQLILGAFDDTSFTCAPDPALWEGDCVTLQRQRIKVNSNYVMSSMGIPLDVETSETVTNRPQRQVG